MGLLAEAFDRLMNPGAYEYRDDSPLELGPTFRFPYQSRSDEIERTLRELRNASGRGQHVDVRGLAKHISTMGEVVAATQAATRIMAVGISYPRYLRFVQLTPGIFNTMDGTTHRAVTSGYDPKTEHYLFCHQFVVECALLVAEVDHYLTPPPWIGG